ncbi:EamA family transporter [Nocardiopsis suaedae]|uniref:EamA family transporter n=1 Tax=Nocardiopsis suaedae TaxID=3018444 RepID=A0ABT4TK03_9ACTN|nr:EamA family transporter [Nocardiopsis suaedae]MDA2805016.1 EamA family transporter [Nocardiopsis suaedae]
MIISLLTRVRAAGARTPAPLLVLFGMFALHTGSALAVHLFDRMGAMGVTWLRLTFAAAVLVVLSGPGLWTAVRRASRRELGSVVILGTVSAGMMGFFSEATARIPLGTATALEFLGPLVVAVVAMRRRAELVWIAAAVAGVLLLTRPWTGGTDPVGIAFGLAGAVTVALYIILTQKVGGSFRPVHALALSMAVGAVVTAPFGAPSALADPSPEGLLAVLGIALLFPVVPFLLEMVALQRMSRAAFSVFAALEPAVSLIMGMVLIQQVPGWGQAAGMMLVVAAGAGAARGDRTPQAVPAGTGSAGEAGATAGDRGGAVRDGGDGRGPRRGRSPEHV